MSAVEKLLLKLKDTKDPYRTLAAHVLSVRVEDVTQDTRYRFKEAFYAMFNHRVGDLVQGAFNDLRELDKLPAVRDHLERKAREG